MRRLLQAQKGCNIKPESDIAVRPHQKHLRAGRQSEPLNCYAITKCVDGRRQLLANDSCAGVIIGSLNFLRRQNEIKLLAFCIMPDHYHVLFVLSGQQSLSDAMKSIGKFTAAQINKLLVRRGGFWQDGFYDHRCRDLDDVIERMAYIEHNPVRAGLVAEAAQWPYSSACPGNAHLLDRQWYSEHC